jgi:hypothetical protein
LDFIEFRAGRRGARAGRPVLDYGLAGKIGRDRRSGNRASGTIAISF